MIRARLRRLLGWVLSVADIGIRIFGFWPEALQVLAILSGWGLVTFGVASLLVWQVWPISLGLFLLSIVGWGHMRMLFGKGLYKLSRSGSKARNVARG